MKSMKLKVKTIVEAYKLLCNAKYQKLSGDDTIKLWKLVRDMKPVAIGYKDAVEDARQMFKPDAEFQQNIAKAKTYEELNDKEGAPMTKEEYEAFIEQLKAYVQLVNKAVEEESEREVDLTFEQLSEDAFGKLITSNDWTLEQVEAIDFIVEY